MLNNLDEDSLLRKNRDYDYKLGAKLKTCQSKFSFITICNKCYIKNFHLQFSLASLSAGQYVSYYTSPVTSYYHNYNGLYSGFSPRLVRPLTHRTVAAPSIVRNVITEPNSPGAKAALSYLSEGSGLDSCGQTTKVNNST